MCGRYTYFSTSGWADKQELQHALAQDRLSAEAIQTWNAAPGTNLPVLIVDDDGELRARSMRWGLVPVWAKEPKIGFNMINARSETIAAKAAYREPLKHTRCLVPATGFYEWKTRGTDGKKVPHHFTHEDGSPCVMAGVWTSWVDRATGEVLDSYTIVTRTADDVVAPVHDRMPVLLGGGADLAWLDAGASIEQLEELMHKATAPRLLDEEASVMVNSVSNNGPQLLVADPQPEPAEIERAFTLFDEPQQPPVD